MNPYDIHSPEYSGVWRVWKAVSVTLFGAFVFILWDIRGTLRAIADERYLRG